MLTGTTHLVFNSCESCY